MAKLEICSSDEEERVFFSEGECGLGQIRSHSAIPFESLSKKRTKGSEGQTVGYQPENRTRTKRTDRYRSRRRRKEYITIGEIQPPSTLVPPGPQQIPLPPVPVNNGVVITEIPVVSRVIQCSSKWIFQHSKII